MLVYHMLLCGSIILCPIYSFYLNEKLNLIKKSKSTVTRPDMIDYELCKIQFMEEKMSRIYNALIELVAAAVFINSALGLVYEKFFFSELETNDGLYDTWILSGSSISISGIPEYYDVANRVYSESDSVYLYVVRSC